MRLEHRDATVRSEEQVGSILERDAMATIADWLSRVKRDDVLSRIVLSDEERTGHLPKLFREIGASPAHATQSRNKTGVRSSCRACQDPSLSGLFDSHDCRRIAYVAGQHIPNLADQPKCGGFRLAPERRNSHSRRSGFTTKTDNRELRGIDSRLAENPRASFSLAAGSPIPDLPVHKPLWLY
jgi:hypothetical protein